MRPCARLTLFPSTPRELTLTRVVTPLDRSCTKTSVTPFASPATRFVASLSKTTTRPSAEIEGSSL